MATYRLKRKTKTYSAEDVLNNAGKAVGNVAGGVSSGFSPDCSVRRFHV